MLNIARNIYFGYDSAKGKYELPEAEVIPYGESANEKRKLENITKKYPTLIDHENIPLPGFTLHKTDRKNWGSIDQTWLVIDPRGFLVRISSQNLEKILHVTGITEGLIQEKCVWARENTETKMTLVPVSSSSYLEAVKNTELIEGKVSMKDVQIGDTVLLQNKLQGVYLGIISLYGPMVDSYKNEYKPQVFMRRQVIEVGPGNYHYQTDLKILKVIARAAQPMSREESLIRIRAGIDRGNSYFGNSSHMAGKYFGVHGRVTHASLHAVPKVSLSFEEISETEATNIFYIGAATTTGDNSILMLEHKNGSKYLVDYPYAYNLPPTPITTHSFDACELMPFDMANAKTLTLTERRNSQMYGSTKKNSISFSFDNFAKFYKIVKHVKNETYV